MIPFQNIWKVSYRSILSMFATFHCCTLKRSHVASCPIIDTFDLDLSTPQKYICLLGQFNKRSRPNQCRPINFHLFMTANEKPTLDIKSLVWKIIIPGKLLLDHAPSFQWSPSCSFAFVTLYVVFNFEFLVVYVCFPFPVFVPGLHSFDFRQHRGSLEQSLKLDICSIIEVVIQDDLPHYNR